MAWVTPSTRTTGDLITAAIWNADVVANTQYLKGQAGSIELEASVISDTDIVDDLGSASKRWANSHVRSVYANRYRATPEIREEQWNWENGDPTQNAHNISVANGGTVTSDAAGQLVLRIDLETTGSLASIKAQNRNIGLETAWSPSRNPYFKCEFGVNTLDVRLDVFIGLTSDPTRATVPLGSTNDFMGILLNVGLWFSQTGNSSAATSEGITVTADSRNQIELWFDDDNNVMETWLNGVKQTDITATLPSAGLLWQLLVTGGTSGGSIDGILTVGQMKIQALTS